MKKKYAALLLGSMLGLSSLNTQAVQVNSRQTIEAVTSTEAIDAKNDVAMGELLEEPAMASIDGESKLKDCYFHFPNQQLPLFYRQSDLDTNITLCFDAYVVTVNQTTKVPVYAAEYISKARLIEGENRKEQNRSVTKEYIYETRLPEVYRATNENYKDTNITGSIYKKGTLVSPDYQVNGLNAIQTYSLANVVPINAKLKSGLWEAINKGFYKFIDDTNNNAYVVTGTYFEGSTYRLGGVNGVAVPAAFYKAFYFPSLGIASAYWVENADTTKYSVLSIDDLTRKINLDVFPRVSADIKAKAVFPPKPILTKTK